MKKSAIFLLVSSAVFAFHCASDNSAILPAEGEPSSCTSCNKPTLVTLYDQATPTTKAAGATVCRTPEFSLATLKTATVQATRSGDTDVNIYSAYGVNPQYNLLGASVTRIDGTHEPRIIATTIVTTASTPCPSVHLTIVGYAWD